IINFFIMAAPFLMTNADYVWTPMTTVTLFILSLIIFLIFIKTKDVVHLTIFILNLLFSILYCLPILFYL
ncbi:TPA: hypothetical protein O0096_002899, partial [Staphylococcus aureus]|nr:hypothetical protein [Staphylococcus aureus]HCJ4445213.1 hypothetical protein [Staphylococcus aureus]HCW9048688.1 hypothetical protein [Staphylococcus aureus]HCX8919180.1 hypothetical protein [Staphylococcus aureus]HCX9006613.1 hypothetical protein [Staphylococcus aureus]